MYIRRYVHIRISLPCKMLNANLSFLIKGHFGLPHIIIGTCKVGVYNTTRIV